MLALLLPMSILDIRKKSVPIPILIGGGLISLLKLAFMLLNGNSVSGTLLTFFIGLLPGLALVLVGFITEKLGAADGISVGILGSLEGYMCGLVCLCLGSLILSLVSIALMCFKKVKKTTRMPFIPFLTAGYVLWFMLTG